MAVRNPAYGQSGEHPILAKVLTKDHKPDDPMEKEAIEELGQFDTCFNYTIFTDSVHAIACPLVIC